MGKLSKHQLLFDDLATALAQIGRLETARELAEAFWLAPLLPPTAKQQPQISGVPPVSWTALMLP